jgi:mannose/fructose/N-acetylgalactosamine-specific phosphotransferase system component IID
MRLSTILLIIAAIMGAVAASLAVAGNAFLAGIFLVIALIDAGTALIFRLYFNH